jgi:hypothetical protein
MLRRTKLDFEPLSLDETAKRLGVPRARARKILALVGVESAEQGAGPLRAKRKARGSKRSSRAKRASAR